MYGLDFSSGIITAVTVEDSTGEVLTVAHMDKDALRKTIDSGLVHYFSTSMKRIRMKGETSGNTQSVKRILANCDGRSLLIRVDQKGPACHTGKKSCFYQDLGDPEVDTEGINYSLAVLRDLESLIQNRKKSLPEGSYTASLFKKGKEEIYKKYGEESVEVLLAEGRERVVYESADMLYHFLVLLALNDVTLDQVMEELSRRRK